MHLKLFGPAIALFLDSINAIDIESVAEAQSLDYNTDLSLIKDESSSLG